MSTNFPVPDSARPPRPTRLAIVLRSERLNPSMVRVVLGGAGLEGFEAGEFTDHYVKLHFPPPGAPYAAPFDAAQVRIRYPSELWPRTRTYTAQRWDPIEQLLSIDFVLHGDEGYAGPWAAAAKPGDRVQLSGPGGAYAPDPTADWHLLVGDESVLPAISASLQRIPAGVPVHVLAEVEGPAEERELATPGELHLSWIHRRAAGGLGATSDKEPLFEAVAALEFPPGRPHCFVHGEAGAVRALRRHLLADRGLPREALSISGYWKRGRTEDGWRAEKPEWNRQVEADLAG